MSAGIVGALIGLIIAIAFPEIKLKSWRFWVILVAAELIAAILQGGKQ